MAEITVSAFCPECGEEMSIRVGLRNRELGVGPIDYCEVVGEYVDRCPECGVELPPELFSQAEEDALERERWAPRRL